MMLSLTQDVGESQEAQKNWEPILRSLRRPQAQGMTKALLRSIHPVDAVTWGGIHLGTWMGFNVNLERIHRVVERTARGLYYHELKRRLPDGYEVLVHSDDTLSRAPPSVLEKLRETILIPLTAISPKIIAPGVFFYRFHADQEDPGLSVWALTFYERKSFLAITGPANSLGSTPGPNPGTSAFDGRPNG
jgi:hypothetical protein